MVVQLCDYIGQGGTIGARFLGLQVMNFNLALGKEGTGVWLAGVFCFGGVGRSAESRGSGVPSDLEVGWADMHVSCPNE